MNAIDGMACATPGCDNRGKPGLNIVGHGSFATRSGRRQRYRCTVCRGTLSTNTGTAYSGLRCTRREFEQLASLRVEGVSLSATARVTGHSRNTIARWLERASTAAKRFNDRMLRDFDISELQAEELCTFIGKKSQTCWLFATIEVSSRLWAGSVLGRRSDRNATAVINDVIRRGRVVGCPLITTDGLEYYVGAVRGLFGSACVYGQVLKTRRNNRVVRVERRVKIGTAHRLKVALLASEDSEALNTSFVERLNLTIRQGSAYLRRRSPCHARGADQLRNHVELVRCHYNFVRPHRALRFGRETRTPAMQTGLVNAHMGWLDIFTAPGLSLRLLVAVVHVSVTVKHAESEAAGVTTRCPPSAWQKGRLIHSERSKHPSCSCVSRSDPACDTLAGLVLGDAEFERLLQVQPELRRGPEISRETQCGIRRDAALAVQNRRDAITRDIQGRSESLRGQLQHIELLAQNLAGMHGPHTIPAHIVVLKSVVVHDLYVTGPVICPPKTQPPLLIDSDAALPSPIARQKLQPVAAQRRQVLQGLRAV